jgi:hypothetical protein
MRDLPSRQHSVDMSTFDRIRRFWLGPGPADPPTEVEREDTELTPTDQRERIWELELDPPPSEDPAGFDR